MNLKFFPLAAASLLFSSAVCADEVSPLYGAQLQVSAAGMTFAPSAWTLDWVSSSGSDGLKKELKKDKEGNILFSIFYQGRSDKNAPRLAGKAKFAQELSV